MQARISLWWDHVRTSFWFVPSCLVLFAWALSWLTTWIDRNPDFQYKAFWLFKGGPEGARAVLTSVASSMITVAGVVFSITIVALTLASQQYGPRLLRNFQRDRLNQFVLGVFIATFLYSLLVVRNVTGATDTVDEFVPVLSVTTSVTLAVVSLGVLILFIHHVASSIHASSIAANVTKELYETVDRLKTAQTSHPNRKKEFNDIRSGPVFVIAAPRSGYLQTIDYDGLMSDATQNNLLIEVLVKPGNFLVNGLPIARVYGTVTLPDTVQYSLKERFITGSYRTSVQDVEFMLDQLVEIAVRALSPGVNDPYTAITCLDRLSESLCYMGNNRAFHPNRFDMQGELRLIVAVYTLEDAINTAFNQIRENSRNNVTVTVHALDSIATIGRCLSSDEARAALLRQAHLIHEGSTPQISVNLDRLVVEEHFQKCLTILSESPKETIPHL